VRLCALRASATERRGILDGRKGSKRNPTVRSVKLTLTDPQSNHADHNHAHDDEEGSSGRSPGYEADCTACRQAARAGSGPGKAPRTGRSEASFVEQSPKLCWDLHTLKLSQPSR
jgi:hypothetical protein